MTTIALTFDIDWAPDEVIEDLLNLLSKYKAKATFFATHQTPVLANLNPQQFEIGIHPNFNNLINGKGDEANFREIIDKFMNWFPNSKGARSHSLVQGTHILNYLKQVGIEYDSNLYSHYQHFSAFHYFNDLIRIPYFFSDDVHVLLKKIFSIKELNISRFIPNVFGFHPIHTYLNTAKTAHYEISKPYYHQATELLKRRNTQVLGTRDLLIETLKYCNENNIPTLLMSEVAATIIKETI